MTFVQVTKMYLHFENMFHCHHSCPIFIVIEGEAKCNRLLQTCQMQSYKDLVPRGLGGKNS